MEKQRRKTFKIEQSLGKASQDIDRRKERTSQENVLDFEKT